jgi:peptidoglycan/LPS O-acetylase OafA/YrhL
VAPQVTNSILTIRFLRIWPTLAFCLLVWYKLSVYWFSGPLWGLYVEQTSFCEGTFWRNLLFIDNMFSHGNNGMSYCFGWGWYLANDF